MNIEKFQKISDNILFHSFHIGMIACLLMFTYTCMTAGFDKAIAWAIPFIVFNVYSDILELRIKMKQLQEHAIASLKVMLSICDAKSALKENKNE